MFSYGEQLTQSGPGSLRRIEESDLYDLLRDPGRKVVDHCEQLRMISKFSSKAADHLKRQLPFFCGSLFREDHRKLELLEEARYFILDLDHCFESEGQFRDLRQQLIHDERVMLLFTSPSGTGIKAAIRLEEPIREPKQFSDAYRAFAWHFGREHKVDQWMDLVTHDATRVCFLSHDPEAYFDFLPEAIDWKAYLKGPGAPPPPPEEKDQEESLPDPPEEEKPPYNDILQRIKDESPKPKKVKVPYVVPEELGLVEQPLHKAFEKQGLTVAEVRDIHYGKKWMLEHGINKAEINVYFGKKGFSVVISPKQGTHPEFNELARQLALGVIYGMEELLPRQQEDAGPATDSGAPEEDGLPF